MAPKPSLPGAREKKVAAFFDIDETLVRGASSYQVTLELYRHHFFGIRDVLFAAYHSFMYVVFGEDKKRLDRLTKRALGVMEGRKVDEVLVVGDNVANWLMAHRIFPGTRHMLEQHLKRGHEVWLLSATPVEVAQLLAQRLGATGAVGTEVEHHGGVYHAALAAPFMHGDGKGTAVRRLAEERHLDLEKSYAYSDSFNDLPMLLTVGNPSAINPDLKLRAYALQKRWRIHDFRRYKRGIVGKYAKSAAKAGGFAWLTALFVNTLLRRG